ncbi:MAG: hypothetical protein WC511_02345 [Candidatus Pacearchaeota archaeon]
MKTSKIFRIHGMKHQFAREVVDTFATQSIDDQGVKMKVVVGGNDKKAFLLYTLWQYLGYTYDATKAFELFNNIPVLTLDEIRAEMRK